MLIAATLIAFGLGLVLLGYVVVGAIQEILVPKSQRKPPQGWSMGDPDIHQIMRKRDDR